MPVIQVWRANLTFDGIRAPGTGANKQHDIRPALIARATSSGEASLFTRFFHIIADAFCDAAVVIWAEQPPFTTANGGGQPADTVSRQACTAHNMHCTGENKKRSLSLPAADMTQVHASEVPCHQCAGIIASHAWALTMLQRLLSMPTIVMMMMMSS
jgi:hypothetical protein